MTVDGTHGPQVRHGVMTADTLAGAELFLADMRARNIHVGAGLAGSAVVVCAACGESWPCATAQGEPA